MQQHLRPMASRSLRTAALLLATACAAVRTEPPPPVQAPAVQHLAADFRYLSSVIRTVDGLLLVGGGYSASPWRMEMQPNGAMRYGQHMPLAHQPWYGKLWADEEGVFLATMRKGDAGTIDILPIQPADQYIVQTLAFPGWRAWRVARHDSDLLVIADEFSGISFAFSFRPLELEPRWATEVGPEPEVVLRAWGAWLLIGQRVSVLDDDGTVRWSRVVSKEMQARSAVPDGDAWAFTGVDTLVGDDGLPGISSPWFIRRIHAKGEMSCRLLALWPDEHNPEFSPMAMDRLKDGGLVLAGHVPAMAVGATSRQLGLVATYPDGRMRWQTEYADLAGVITASVAEDGHIVAGGYDATGASWVLRADTWGHLAGSLAAQACSKLAAAPCDDGNPCTTDRCVSGACAHGAAWENTGCPGGLCRSGACVAVDLGWNAAGCPGK